MIKLYGIKNCDTVKKARDWLAHKNIAYQFHDFRIDGITSAQIDQWIDALGLETLLNKRSTTWKELDENIKTNFNAQNASTIIAEYPTLIKRPVLDTGKQLLVGFKDSEYTTIFN